MPHNRTRIWVGLAIVAVTIPAVGLTYYNSSRSGLGQNAVASNDRWSAGTGLRGARPVRTRVGSPGVSRDYLSEVAGLTRRATPNAADGTLASRTQQASDNSLDWSYDDLDSAYDAPYLSDLPDPAETMAPRDAEGNNGPTDNGVLDDADVPPPDDGAIADDRGPSDREVYNSMLASFSDDDRDTFVRTWALMSDDQRQKVLDDYRSNN